MFYARCVILANPVELKVSPFCRPCPAILNHFGGSEIRATKTGERVTVGSPARWPGFLFGSALVLWTLLTKLS